LFLRFVPLVSILKGGAIVADDSRSCFPSTNSMGPVCLLGGRGSLPC
jgi:hypothetical protein